MTDTAVTSKDALRERYIAPKGRAVAKQLDRLDRHCRAFLELSPFCTLASTDAAGHVDCSPRGDKPGFARAVDDRTLLLPDRPGNNRLDSLTNIVEHPEVGLLFMVPGFNETLRINGRADIVTDPDVCAQFAENGKPARSIMRIAVREVYFHCAKAFVRARLWDPAAQRDRKSFPSLGTILADQTCMGTAAEADAFVEESIKTGLW
jgi:uncharacterized protein